MLNGSVRIPKTQDITAVTGAQENAEASSCFHSDEEIRRPAVDQFCRTARNEHDGLSRHKEDQLEDRVRSVNEPGSVSAAWEQKLIMFMQIAEGRRELLLWRAQRITNSREDAEDIVQEALLKGFKYLPQFRGESMMCTWLVAIVQNLGREWLRIHRRRTFLPLGPVAEGDEASLLDLLPDPCEDPERSCERREMSDMLLAEIDELSTACKQALQMCALEGRSHLEVADALGTRACTIKARVSRGKRMLKRAITIRTGA